MMSYYKVLLIDDQYKDESIQTFVLNASYSDIEIHCVGFHKEGIDLLKNDKKHEYQAVILDATGFVSKADLEAGKDLSNTGLLYSLKYLSDTRNERVIPWFIFSGAPRNIDNDEFVDTIKTYQENIKFGRPEIVFYQKTKMEDEEALLEDLKLEIDNLSNTKIINSYSNVFNAISGVSTLEKHRNNLINILHNIDNNSDYTQIRKILESLFKALADVNIIPEGFTEEKGWINGTSLFLSGKHSDYEFLEADFIHPTICETLYRVLNVVQDGSHNEGSLKLKVDDYSRNYTSGYLYKSVVYGLLEILCYFGELIKNNQNIEENQSRWKKKETAKTKEVFIEAIFQSINDANWGTIKCIDGKEVSVHPKSIETHNLAIGEIIWVSLEFNEPKNKYHIINIKKING